MATDTATPTGTPAQVLSRRQASGGNPAALSSLSPLAVPSLLLPRPPQPDPPIGVAEAARPCAFSAEATCPT